MPHVLVIGWISICPFCVLLTEQRMSAICRTVTFGEVFEGVIEESNIQSPRNSEISITFLLTLVCIDIERIHWSGELMVLPFLIGTPQCPLYCVCYCYSLVFFFSWSPIIYTQRLSTRRKSNLQWVIYQHFINTCI